MEWSASNKDRHFAYDIDGDCTYQLPYDEKDRFASRPWKKAITSNTTEVGGGKRKIAKCKGSFERQSQNCLFLKEYGRHKKANFDIISSDCSVCRICKSPAVFLDCPVVKVWEFDDNYFVVKHSGKHTCSYVPLVANNEHAIAQHLQMLICHPRNFKEKLC